MAKSGKTNISGGGGIGSDELSTTKKQVLKGKTYVGADTNDESGVGELDLDVITVTSPDMLAGKVGVDKVGNPMFGTMVNHGAVNQSLAINSTYSIPLGYHNGQGKVTQSIATMGAQTINPTASQQTVSSSGKYMTGNVVVNGVSNLISDNIKKSAVVGGVTGTCDYAYRLPAREQIFNLAKMSVTQRSITDLRSGITQLPPIWQGVIHPEWPYVILKINSTDLFIVGTGAADGLASPLEIDSNGVYAFYLARRSGGNTSLYATSTTGDLRASYMYCYGYTTANFGNSAV